MLCLASGVLVMLMGCTRYAIMNYGITRASKQLTHDEQRHSPE